MKIVYIPTLNPGVIHWRIENYAQEMLNLHPEVSVHVNYMPGFQEQVAWDKICLGYGDVSKQIQQQLESCFRKYDVIIVQKIQYAEGLAVIQKYREMYPDVKIIAEMDDSVGHVDSSNPHYLQFAKHHKWAAEHCQISDGIICSTRYLKESLLKFNKTIHVAPNCINTDLWKFKLKKKKGKEIRIGYVGAGSHEHDMKIAYKAILPLLDDHNIKFIIRYGNVRPKWLKRHKKIDFKAVAWKLDKYPQELANLTLDLALAPIRDTEFNRCKSNLKYIEWASLGVPLLASFVQPYAHTNGNIHLVTNSVTSWRQYILDLLPFIKNITTKEKQELANHSLKTYNMAIEAKRVVDWLETVKVAENAKERIIR